MLDPDSCGMSRCLRCEGRGSVGGGVGGTARRWIFFGGELTGVVEAAEFAWYTVIRMRNPVQVA